MVTDDPSICVYVLAADGKRSDALKQQARLRRLGSPIQEALNTPAYIKLLRDGGIDEVDLWILERGVRPKRMTRVAARSYEVFATLDGTRLLQLHPSEAEFVLLHLSHLMLSQVPALMATQWPEVSAPPITTTDPEDLVELAVQGLAR